MDLIVWLNLWRDRAQPTPRRLASLAGAGALALWGGGLGLAGLAGLQPAAWLGWPWPGLLTLAGWVALSRGVYLLGYGAWLAWSGRPAGAIRRGDQAPPAGGPALDPANVARFRPLASRHPLPAGLAMFALGVGCLAGSLAAGVAGMFLLPWLAGRLSRG